ncbi:MAG: hypothetical protein P1U88_06120 [Thalassobaculaceae bacterium]|nr:hypothetical protein [Thalassobaculaceae bacterium]
MPAHAPLNPDTFDALEREMERALVDPFASSVAMRTATGCVIRFASAYRSAVASGGVLRQSAERGNAHLRHRLVRTLLPTLEEVFTALAETNWHWDDERPSIEGTAPPDAAGLLKAVAEWERANTTNTDANALVDRLCARMTDDAKRCVDRFKADQSPEDAPDYRAVTTSIVTFEALINLAVRLGRPTSAEEIVRLRDHHVKTALLAALAVIQRADDHTDMFVHFDVAAMLVSVEHVVAVISTTLAVVDREREHAHPHVETVSEHVVRDFAKGLIRLAPSYVKMLRKAMSVQGKAVPEFGFSLLRVLVQITRLIRSLHHMLRDPGLADAADGIAADVADLRGNLLETATIDPEMLVRVQEALDAILPSPAPGRRPDGAPGADRP